MASWNDTPKRKHSKREWATVIILTIIAIIVSVMVARADGNTITATQTGNHYRFECDTGADTVTVMAGRVSVLTMPGDCGGEWVGDGTLTATAETCEPYDDYVMCSVRPLKIEFMYRVMLPMVVGL